MSKGDWLVLCALSIEHEHGYRHALCFVRRYFRENETSLISHPSVKWWIKTKMRNFRHELMEDGLIDWRTA